jgi:hypothetical protein
MTFTRRPTPIGPAATIAAAALPAAALAGAANGEVTVDPNRRFRNVDVGCTGRRCDWIGRHDFNGTVRVPGEGESIADHDPSDFREIA